MTLLLTQVDAIETYINHVISSCDDLLSTLYGNIDDASESAFSLDFLHAGLKSESPRSHNIVEQDKRRFAALPFSILQPTTYEKIGDVAEEELKE